MVLPHDFRLHFGAGLAADERRVVDSDVIRVGIVEAMAAMAKAAAAVAVIVRVDARLRFMSISFERGVVRSGTCGPLNARMPRLVNSTRFAKYGDRLRKHHCAGV